MCPETILETRSLHYTYPDGTPALRNVNLAIPKGEKIAVLGPNGAGKTTLFLHLNGILKPQGGSVLFNGQPVAYDRRGLRQLRTAVQIVFHEPDAQLFAARVSQDISFGALNLGLNDEEVRRRVDEALKTVDIEHLRDKPTHFLSHGEKKRVAVAGALVMEPRVLIIDEPTSGIDPGHQHALIELLNRLNRDGVTILLSTHDVEIAWEWADRVIVMHEGGIARETDPASLFLDTSLLNTSGLRKPPAFELFETLLELGILPPDTAPPAGTTELRELLRAARDK